jgi:hypothetical protein
VRHVLKMLFNVLGYGAFSVAFTACAVGDNYLLTQPPNYDHLINKSFTQSIFKGRQVFKKVREIEQIEELENRRKDGCILVFGVHKENDMIKYWRVDSGPGTCFVPRKPSNV